MTRRKHWSFYDPDTGRFTGQQAAGTAEWLEANTPAGCAAIEGSFNHERERVDVETGEVIFFRSEAPPATELQDWAWDDAVGWVPVQTPLAKAHAARTQRARLLAASDWVVTRAAERNEPVPAPWLTYRAALRDITEQAGFPTSIDWPAPPA